MYLLLLKANVPLDDERGFIVLKSCQHYEWMVCLSKFSERKESTFWHKIVKIIMPLCLLKIGRKKKLSRVDIRGSPRADIKVIPEQRLGEVPEQWIRVWNNDLIN